MAKLWVASGRTLSHRGHRTWLSGELVDDDWQGIIGADNIQRLLDTGVLTAEQDTLSAEESARLISKGGKA